ncbi:E3 SUMO-protein ligase PIAS3-like isoform X3 [Orbicella faveolata]|uniref:E3 SUMO-protein ligase PIAS3-like isoform X3 n=1 Tax=Orbicella faveolata TaxID=48498 RepID=UPI0009E5C3A9|nr:E3 SUMO-protein ligase PIAS3-like isoform X3 [Orbicella faveolata]
MDELADLRHMLLSFRVSELQSLLGFAGRSKSGRKHELMGRALQMLKSDGNNPVRKKLRELYERRCPRKVVVPQPQPRAVIPQPVQRPSAINSDTTGVPVHPDVRLSHLPFFEHIDDLVRPTSLVPRGMSQFQEAYVMFHFTPSQVQLISNSGDTRPNYRNEFTVQVQLRFCLFETSCEQEDNFPSSLCIKVNGKICPLTGNTSQHCNPNTESKRPSKPVNITPLCRLSPTVANHIHITWTPKYGQRHVVTAKLVRAVTSSCLIQRLKAHGYRNPDHSRALIKEKLAHDPDSEVATTSLRVSLLCPLGKTRMTLPCRAITCNHLQCFDAALYLQMNERKTTWICPVCDQKATFGKLVLDGLFKEILEAAANCNEISFHEDGSWRPINDLQEQESKKALSALVATTVLSTPDRSVTSSKQHLQEARDDERKKEKEVQVIDLTLDSDSESDRNDDDDNDNSEEYSEERDLNTPRPSFGVGVSGIKRPPSLNTMVFPTNTNTIPGSSASSLLNPNFFPSPLDFACQGLDLDSIYPGPLFPPNEPYAAMYGLLGPHGSSNVIQLD